MVSPADPCPACGCTGNDHNKRRVSVDGRIRMGAAHLGIAVEAYRSHVENGEKWCAGCRAWHAREAFGKRWNASDGLNNVCKKSSRASVLASQARRRAERAAS